jgi:hypothetical protein
VTHCAATTVLISHYGSDTPRRPCSMQHVRNLTRQEQACCAFLTFEIHEQPDEVTGGAIGVYVVKEALEIVSEAREARANARSGSSP